MSNAVSKAVANHPRVDSARYSSEASRQEAKIVKSGLFPQLSLRGSVGPEFRDRDIVGTSTDEWFSARELRAVLRQQIFHGFLTIKDTRAAGMRAQAQELLEQGVREDLAMEVAEVYLGVKRAREQIVLAQDNIQVHVDSKDKTQQRVDAGKGQKADLDLVEGRLGLARSSLDTRNTLLENALVRYKQLVGENASSSLSMPQAVPAGALPSSLASADTSGNWSRRAAQMSYEAARMSADAGSGLYWPRFDLEVSGGVGEEIGGINGQDNDFRALLVGTWDVYAGGSLRAEKHLRDATSKEALANVGDAILLADEDLGRAMADRDGARSQIGALSTYAESMVEVVDAYQQQLEIGNRSILNLLDVENEEFRANSALVDARYALRLSEYRMIATMGRLVSLLTGADVTGGGRSPVADYRNPVPADSSPSIAFDAEEDAAVVASEIRESGADPEEVEIEIVESGKKKGGFFGLFRKKDKGAAADTEIVVSEVATEAPMGSVADPYPPAPPESIESIESTELSDSGYGGNKVVIKETPLE
ncbi:MAG: TolC family protein, partial [Verrucomicrobiales bacterium]